MQTMVRKSPKAAQMERPVEARKAAELAFDYFDTLFSKKGRPVSDPSLEEIETTKDGRFWLVTLGFNAARPINPHLPEFLQVPVRKLKVFKVDAANGRVLSMKIPQDE